MSIVATTPISNTSLYPSQIRIVLVEDNVHYQQAVIQSINRAEDMTLIGMADTLAEALNLLKLPAPDVLLVDLGLPDGSGIKLIHAANLAWSTCNIMVCTALGDEAHVIRSIEAGASGYLLKDSHPDNILSEIRSLHNGGSPISPLIARQILTRFHTSTSITSSAQNNIPQLSVREQQVLELIMRGFTTEEISKLLSVSRYTVQTYIRRTYAKLNVSSKTEAIYEAQQHGLLRH